jgi:hypothetical protein
MLVLLHTHLYQRRLQFNEKAFGSICIEQGLTNDVFGVSSHSLISTVENDVYNAIKQFGLYRVTGITY